MQPSVFGNRDLYVAYHSAQDKFRFGIAACAYVYARRHASDDRLSFGTGKVDALAASLSTRPSSSRSRAFS